MSKVPSVLILMARSAQCQESSSSISLTKDTQHFCVTTLAHAPSPSHTMTSSRKIRNYLPSMEPTELCAPILVTTKKDPEWIRMCVDLNRFVHRECTPLWHPLIALKQWQTEPSPAPTTLQLYSLRCIEIKDTTNTLEVSQQLTTCT